MTTADAIAGDINRVLTFLITRRLTMPDCLERYVALFAAIARMDRELAAQVFCEPGLRPLLLGVLAFLRQDIPDSYDHSDLVWRARHPPSIALQKIGIGRCVFDQCDHHVQPKYVLCKSHQAAIVRIHQRIARYLPAGLIEICANYILPDYEHLELRSKRHERRHTRSGGFAVVTVYDLVRPDLKRI